jgi:hypothetical protein
MSSQSGPPNAADTRAQLEAEERAAKQRGWTYVCNEVLPHVNRTLHSAASVSFALPHGFHIRGNRERVDVTSSQEGKVWWAEYLLKALRARALDYVGYDVAFLGAKYIHDRGRWVYKEVVLDKEHMLQAAQAHLAIRRTDQMAAGFIVRITLQ